MKVHRLILIAVLLPGVAFCQNASKSEGGFYPQGYVRGLMNSSPGKPVEIDGQQDNEENYKEKEDLPISQPLSEIPVAVPQKAERPSDARAGVKVKSIGAIFSTGTAGRMQSDMQILLSATKEINVTAGHIFYIMAQFPDFSNGRELFKPALDIGGDVHIRLSLPAEYSQVKSTPTWIISTVKGDVLLEGVLDPLQYFNSKGEFVEPESNQAVMAQPKIPISDPEAATLNDPQKNS